MMFAEVMNLHIIQNIFFKKRNRSKRQSYKKIDIASIFQRAQKKTPQDASVITLSFPTPSTFSSATTTSLESAPVHIVDSDSG